MSVVHLIDTVAEWAKANICDLVKLKQPPADPEAPDDAGYAYTLVNPAVFPMYIPKQESLPPPVHSPYPALCVTTMAGQDNLASNDGYVDLQFCFCAWDPGIHGKDVFYANGDGTHRQWSGAEAEAYYQRHHGGWRDAWNFADVALRAVESVTHIGGYVIDRATPVKFGPLAVQDAVENFYPMWYAWISFRVTYPLARNVPDFQNLL